MCKAKNRTGKMEGWIVFSSFASVKATGTTEERLRGLKRALYEGGMRVPYIAYWPGTIEAGSISDLMAAGWDMLPTFVELLGEDTDWHVDAMDGLTILPT